MDIDYTPTKTVKAFMQSDAKMRVLMGPVGCLAPETLVVTEYGLLPIADINRPMRVLSWNDKTCRFQLSWCGGSFPKGTDYLYRVTTQQGEFAANEHHLVYDGQRAYRHVRSLCPGQFVSQYCGDQPLTDLVHNLLSSQQDDERSRRTAEGSLASYARSARQRGLQLLREEGTDLAFVPKQGDAHTSSWSIGSYAFEHTGGRLAPLLKRIRQGLSDGLRHIGDWMHRAVRLRLTGVSRAEAVLCVHTGATTQQALRSVQTSDARQPTRLSASCSRSFDLTSISDRPIVDVRREEVKRSYWDLQVLDTNNYVTADGAIHHNSGKSIASCFEIIRRASIQKPDPNTGKHRTRCAVVRETVRQLQDTTIKSFLDWFPPGVCGRYMRTTKTYFFEVGDVECEIMFRALDDADDVANLNSLELTFAWFNECRDIAPEIVDAMSKRIGRFPSAKDGGPTWHGMWGDTNPPTMDSWWYYQMEGLDPKDGVSPNNNGWAVFKQPSGRSVYAENIENLPDGYYDTQGRSEEYIRVFIDGEYGLSSAGMPVYKYFRTDYHMARDTLRPIMNGVRPVIVGMDLGLTPAAVIGQQDARGRALILDECVSFDMGVQRFMRTMLRPLLSERFSAAPVLIVTDPAGIQRAQTDERSAVDIIRAEGFKVIPAKTNNVSARINSVDDYLMRQVDGDPAFLLDPRCTQLKAAMMGGYRYKLRGDGDIDKNKHSHVAEALQYLMLHLGNGGEAALQRQRREIKRVPATGWT
jgi:hypothetical protein